MKMKKVIALALAGTMAASMAAGCGGSGKDSSATEAAKTEAKTEAKAEAKTEAKSDVKSGKRVPRKRSVRSRSGGKRSGVSNVVVYGIVRRSQKAGDAIYDPCRRMRQRTEYFGCSAVWGIQDRTWDRTSRTKRGDRILPGQTDRD